MADSTECREGKHAAEARLYTGRTKTCVRCKTDKTASEENYRVTSNGTGWSLKAVCRACEIDERIALRRANSERENASRRASSTFERRRRHKLRKRGLSEEAYAVLRDSAKVLRAALSYLERHGKE